MDSTVPTTTKQSFLHRYNVLLKLHYFLFFSGFGILIPVLNITLRSRGLSNSELSYINTIIPFVVFFTNPLCGFIADRSRRYKLTFNVILTAVILLFGTIFLLPKIESEQIHAKLIDVPKQGRMLDFCASQELATKCASRSSCGCTYHAHCRTIDASNELQHFTLDFSMDAKEKFTKSLDPIDAVGELTCGVEYRVAINEKSLGEYARSNRTVHCEISCSEADLCRGSRSPNQMNFILLYSLLFILGNILFANAITVGSSLGFASLADPSIFGQQRLWGTIGFGLSALGVSRVFSYVGSEYVYIIMFVVTSALCILFTSFIRIQPKKTPVKQIETNEDPSMTKEKSPSGVAALIPLLKKLDVFIFLSLAFLWGTSYAVLDPYLYLYLDEVKPCRSRSIIGYMSATSATAEFIALFLAGKILKSVGTNKASILILTAFGIRFGGYYLIQEPIFWTFMETMHFFNFGILLVLIAQEADEMAPPGLSGTLQGVALGVCFGLGRGIGLLISSVIYNIIGQRTLFFTFSILNLSAALLYSLYFFICRRKKSSNSSSAKKNITLESEKNRNEQPLLVHS